MDFCLTRIYTKFYISQILHAMKYIEYNHINFYLQEDLIDMEIDTQKVLETPKKNKSEAKSDNNCNINAQINPASYISTEKLINEKLNKQNNEILNLNSQNNTQAQEEMDLNEEEKMLLDEVEKESSVNEDLMLSAGKSNNEYKAFEEQTTQILPKKASETEPEQEPELNVNYEELNCINNNVEVNENESSKAKNVKKFELIELNKENETRYRKTFVYKNNVFSKVEIQGLVVDRRVLGHIDKNNYRMKLIIDDSTGSIEVFVWRSKKENVFNKLRDEVRCGMVVRILGLIDNYKDSFEINLEYFEMIKTWKQELLFHKSLQINQKTLKDSKLLGILESLNNFESSNINSISNTNAKNNCNINNNASASIKNYSNWNSKNKLNSNQSSGKYEKETSSKNNKSLYVKKKDFANRILAFFRKYKLNDELNPEKNYIILKINSLISNTHFNTMMNDFCRDNGISDPNKFLIESLTIIEENSMGKLIEDEQSVEIKLDDEVNNEIIRMLRSNPEGMNYMDISDHISVTFNNFFMNDFIKYIIEELIQNGKIQAIHQNFYQIMN